MPPPSSARVTIGELPFDKGLSDRSWSSAVHPSAERILALDGLRGLMMIFVLVSHYFAEVPGGIDALGFGWVGVDMFFVLSGFVVGRVILDKGRSANFYRVFYLRRACRTFPLYFACLVGTIGLVAGLVPGMARQNPSLPVWSYFTFTQNIMMVVRQSIGAHWLLETWTLAVEEQFYLFAPAIMLLTPRKLLLPVLVGIGLGSVALRVDLHLGGASPLAGLVLLPSRADDLICGLVGAVVVARHPIVGPRLTLRFAPVALLFAVAAIRLAEPDTGLVFASIGHLVVASGCACFVVALVGGSPEAARFQAPALRFCGAISYAVYLTHLPVLWLLHGLALGAEPSLIGRGGWAVTLLALPVTFLLAWLLTRGLGDPFVAYGRSWRWDGPKRGAA